MSHLTSICHYGAYYKNSACFSWDRIDEAVKIGSSEKAIIQELDVLTEHFRTSAQKIFAQQPAPAGETIGSSVD